MRGCVLRGCVWHCESVSVCFDVVHVCAGNGFSPHLRCATLTLSVVAADKIMEEVDRFQELQLEIENERERQVDARKKLVSAHDRVIKVCCPCCSLPPRRCCGLVLGVVTVCTACVQVPVTMVLAEGCFPIGNYGAGFWPCVCVFLAGRCCKRSATQRRRRCVGDGKKRRTR